MFASDRSFWRLTFALALSVPLALSACDGEGPDPDEDAGVETDAGEPPAAAACENINPAHCMAPWPSDFFTEADSTTATGIRVAVPEESTPTDRNGNHIDPALVNRFDGFSPMSTAVTTFPGAIDTAGLIDDRHIADSLLPSANTLLIDAETGEQVPHFSEVDEWPAVDPASAPLYIRPAIRLQEGHRYIVAIRNLSYVGGAPVEASEYFAALRDGTELADTDIEDRRAHFEELFGTLSDAGVDRASLLEAWDFTTASGQTIWGDLVAMRDDAMERLTETGLGCTIEEVEEGEALGGHAETIFRRVHGTVTVPLYLVGDRVTVAESRLNRGADGMPAFNGTVEVPFTAQIPNSVRDRILAGEGPGRLETYGHGLFGDRGEVESGWHRTHQDTLGIVSVAVDWWGMSSQDVARVVMSLQGFSTFDATTDRLAQGVLNFMAVTRSFAGAGAAAGICSTQPELQIDMGDGTLVPSFDTSTPSYYYGNSQGGIMGGVVAGVSVDIERFALGVGGMAYPMMILRSSNWQTYGDAMAIGYPDAFVRGLVMAMSGIQWDRAEPSTYSPHLITDPLPGTPAKRILMAIGMGDAQVSNANSELQARTIGLPVMTPTPYPTWGLEETAGPAESALVIYQIPGAERSLPGTRDPGEDNPAHEGVRRSPASLEQMNRFFRPDGMIEQTCDGICDPE